MSQTNYPGIDYGLGRTNISQEGIRFGVIPANDVGQAWYDGAESHYGEPHCPKCGNEALEYHKATETIGEHIAEWPSERGECDDFACEHCERLFGSESAFPDSPRSFYVDDGEIKAEQGGEDCDIFILKSPFFTYAQFCSPCAPGACYLRSPLETPSESNRAYCFGHDWFESGVAPYLVYSVATGELVQPTVS